MENAFALVFDVSLVVAVVALLNKYGTQLWTLTVGALVVVFVLASLFRMA